MRILSGGVSQAERTVCSKALGWKELGAPEDMEEGPDGCSRGHEGVAPTCTGELLAAGTHPLSWSFLQSGTKM